MSELSRDIQALAGDLARLRTEIERFRTELRAVVDRFLDDERLTGASRTLNGRRGEQPGKAEGTGPLPGCSHAPI